MERQFEEVAERIANEVTERVTAAVNTHVTAVERRLSDQARMNAEAVMATARLAAEGFAATLEGIDRRIADLESTVKSQFRHHDKILSKPHRSHQRTRTQA